MVFSDQSFLFLFLPAALFLYFLLRATPLALPVVLASSLIFYFWASGNYLLILIASIVINFIGGLWVGTKRRKFALPIVILLNLALLIYFKYGFFVASNLPIASDPGVGEWLRAIVLPVGISFFTFQGISYVVDVARGTVAPERNPITFGAYISFFPQLIAGPIVRYKDVHRDFNAPKTSLQNVTDGAMRFMHGLVKKVVVADSVARVADAAFAVPGADVVFIVALVAAVAYAIQIYFDFSGYSDMAIGLGLIFGIRFLENFERPYVSKTITEFWRRWHISLSSWIRDYLYIPLGGNRNGSANTYCNLLIAFAATGLWHGASWTFLAWGLYHGFFIAAERLVLGGSAKVMRNSALRFIYCLPVVLVGWIIFRADTFDQAWTLISALGTPFSAKALVMPASLYATLTPDATVILTLSCLIFLLPGRYGLGHSLGMPAANTPIALLRVGYIIGCAAIATMIVLSQGYSPFLYFRF